MWDAYDCPKVFVQRGFAVLAGREERITIDGNPVRLLLANGYDGRGTTSDVVYLSETARMQLDHARAVGAIVK